MSDSTSILKSTSRFILVLALFVSALSLGTSDAQTTATCPAGFDLSADAQTCTQAAPSAPSPCAEGMLTPNGARCYTPAIVDETTSTSTTAPIQTTDQQCPAGSTPDTSNGSLRCRVAGAAAPTTTTTFSCPTGSTGNPTAADPTCTREVATTEAVDPLLTTTFDCLGTSTGNPTAADPTCTREVTTAVPIDCPFGLAELTSASDTVSASTALGTGYGACLLYTSPSPRDATLSRMPSSA